MVELLNQSNGQMNWSKIIEMYVQHSDKRHSEVLRPPRLIDQRYPGLDDTQYLFQNYDKQTKCDGGYVIQNIFALQYVIPIVIILR